VQLVGTAHGNSLENLLMNPTLSDLVGGIQAVTLSDEEAKRRGTQKTVLERKAPPTFEVIIEIMEVDKLAIHHDVTGVVDRFLRGEQPRPEIRVRNPEGDIEIVQSAERHIREVRGDEEDEGEEDGDRPRNGTRSVARDGFRSPAAPSIRRETKGNVRIFPYGVNRNRLDRAILEGRVPATIARDVSEADVVIALKASYRREPAKMRDGGSRNLPTYIIKSNTYAQIANAVRDIFQAGGIEKGFMDEALREAEDAVQRVMETKQPVELSPQNSYMRRLQHQLIEKHSLISESVGEEPRRRVRIFPNG
jgi:hypothetical protein